MLQLRCTVCHLPFGFSRGVTALVLRHTAYGHDFVHAQDISTALEWIFFDPEYDRPEFQLRRESCTVPRRGTARWLDGHDGSRYPEELLRDPELKAPHWQPRLPSPVRGTFRMVDLLTFAQLDPISRGQ